MIEWNIQSRAHACRSCARPFVHHQAYHTLLFDERGAYERIDVCEPCWAGQYSQSTSRKGFISHWQGSYEAPPPQPELVRKETAETLLRKLITLADPRYSAATFILAAMLERKRLLKVQDQLRRDGRRYFVYEHPATGDVFTVADPELSLGELDEVQKDVAQLLEHGLPDPALPGTPPSEPSASSLPNPAPEPAPPSQTP